MTPEELKTILKSKGNKIAKEAIELIKNEKPVSELGILLAKGCPDTFYERNPSSPRKSYLTHHVLDACFESRMSTTKTTEEITDGILIQNATIDHTHNSQGREPHFELLLKAGFKPGSNNYRGELFQHILNSCFSNMGGEEKKIRYQLCKNTYRTKESRHQLLRGK